MSDSEASHDELRRQVFGALSDMGTEKGAADMNTMKPVIGTSDNRIDVSAGMQYPNALYMAEHLHVLFSALQHGVEDTWHEALDQEGEHVGVVLA